MTRRATVLLAIAALAGFAGNSLLCRAALGDRAIDPATFTAIRIVAGALTLAAIAFGSRHASAPDPSRVRRGSWLSALALVVYAVAFSFAYLRITAATGALILFASVQVSMIGLGILRGARPRPLEWLGLAIAIGGLVLLVGPRLERPDPLGACAMAIAGASWGIYSLHGAATKHADPLAITADNFLRAVPFVGIAVIAMAITTGLHASPRGIVLAIASGALASGIGYTLWYAALPYLAPMRAAVIQLAVPVITALAAGVLLDEPLTARFAFAAATIVGGIAIAILAKRR